MMDLLKRPEFWAAMLFAIIVKLRASPRLTIIGAGMTSIVAVTGALIFTEPAAEWLDLHGTAMQPAIAALVALTCEHVARLILNLTPAEVIKWLTK